MSRRHLLPIALFAFLPSGLAQTASVTTLFSFPSANYFSPNAAQLIQAADGNFYGLTNYNLEFFRLSPDGTYTPILELPSSVMPASDIVQGPDGAFFTVLNGSASGTCDSPNFCGAIARLTSSGGFQIEHLFTGGSDGANPGGRLVLGADGNFYGTASAGGSTSGSCGSTALLLPGCGAIFRMTPAGAFQVVYTFTGATDGLAPGSGLFQASDGNFYGTTFGQPDAEGCSPGGLSSAPDCGTVFQFTSGGKLSTVAAFAYGGDTFDNFFTLTPAEGDDDSLYGVTDTPNDNGTDTIYKISGSGALTTLDNQSAESGGISPLFAASDGNLYGAESFFNGSSSTYKVLQLSSVSGISTIFQSTSGSSGGVFFNDGLVQGNDGAFYGTASSEGSQSEYGVVYRLAISPALPPPVQIELSANQVLVGESVTASFKVLNAYSLTMQQCYGFVTSNGVTTPLGKVQGSYSASTKLYTGAVTFEPSVGTYNYALTCGGIESGYATLAVGYPTTTNLAANPASVTPPGTVSLQATVTRSASGATGTPTGTVTFSSGSVTIGTASLNGSGVANYSASTSGISAGNYTVVANYNGDGSDTASTSSGVVVTVK